MTALLARLSIHDIRREFPAPDPFFAARFAVGRQMTAYATARGLIDLEDLETVERARVTKEQLLEAARNAGWRESSRAR